MCDVVAAFCYTRVFLHAGVELQSIRSGLENSFPFLIFFFNTFLLHAVCFTRGCCPSYSLSFLFRSSLFSSGLVKNKTL